MIICDSGHEAIVIGSNWIRDCPLCEALVTISDLETQLNEAEEKLND